MFFRARLIQRKEMNSSKFGPVVWPLYFTCASTCMPGDWSETTIEQFLLIFSSNAMILPCVFCRESFRIFFRVLDSRKWFQGPLRLQTMNSDVATEYLFLFHNFVNQKLDKPWHFDKQSAVASNILIDERSLMTHVFEWLYILFLNYPESLGPIDVEESECCNETCQKGHQQMTDEPIKIKRCVRKATRDCIGQPLSDAFEHLKKQITTMSFLAEANAQGVTIGSFINQKIILPVYQTLPKNIQEAIDLYTFTKIAWYMILIHNLTNLLITCSCLSLSAEAVRSLRQLQSRFLHPMQTKMQGKCGCFVQTERSLNECLKQHLGVWSSSAEAVRNIHVAQQWWDLKTEPLAETRKRIEEYRVKKTHN